MGATCSQVKGDPNVNLKKQCAGAPRLSRTRSELESESTPDGLPYEFFQPVTTYISAIPLKDARSPSSASLTKNQWFRLMQSRGRIVIEDKQFQGSSLRARGSPMTWDDLLGLKKFPGFRIITSPTYSTEYVEIFKLAIQGVSCRCARHFIPQQDSCLVCHCNAVGAKILKVREMISNDFNKFPRLSAAIGNFIDYLVNQTLQDADLYSLWSPNLLEKFLVIFSSNACVSLVLKRLRNFCECRRISQEADNGLAEHLDIIIRSLCLKHESLEISSIPGLNTSLYKTESRDEDDSSTEASDSFFVVSEPTLPVKPGNTWKFLTGDTSSIQYLQRKRFERYKNVETIHRDLIQTEKARKLAKQKPIKPRNHQRQEQEQSIMEQSVSRKNEEISRFRADLDAQIREKKEKIRNLKNQETADALVAKRKLEIEAEILSKEFSRLLEAEKINGMKTEWRIKRMMNYKKLRALTIIENRQHKIDIKLNKIQNTTPPSSPESASDQICNFPRRYGPLRDPSISHQVPEELQIKSESESEEDEHADQIPSDVQDDDVKTEFSAAASMTPTSAVGTENSRMVKIRTDPSTLPAAGMRPKQVDIDYPTSTSPIPMTDGNELDFELPEVPEPGNLKALDDEWIPLDVLKKRDPFEVLFSNQTAEDSFLFRSSLKSQGIFSLFENVLKFAFLQTGTDRLIEVLDGGFLDQSLNIAGVAVEISRFMSGGSEGFWAVERKPGSLAFDFGSFVDSLILTKIPRDLKSELISRCIEESSMNILFRFSCKLAYANYCVKELWLENKKTSENKLVWRVLRIVGLVSDFFYIHVVDREIKKFLAQKNLYGSEKDLLTGLRDCMLEISRGIIVFLEPIEKILCAVVDMRISGDYGKAATKIAEGQKALIAIFKKKRKNSVLQLLFDFNNYFHTQ